MKILLQEGHNNQPVQFERLTITPVRLYIEEKPWSGRGAPVSLELNIAGEYFEDSFYLYDWAMGDEQPVAIENYLFSLETDDTHARTDVRLVVGKTAFNTPFLLGFNRQADFDGLTVWFEDAIHETATYEPGGPEVHDSSIKLTLREKNKRGAFTFMASELCKEGQLVYEWGDYRVRVLGIEESLKLKVEKKEP